VDHLPIFCQLRNRDCLLVGGGDVAERKARLLLEAGARLTVNALTFAPQFEVWAQEGMLTLEQGEFNESLLDTCWLTIAATDDDEVNQRVSDACEARRIFCNVVDAPKEASFIMPSIIDRSPLMIAVSSGDARRFSRACCGKNWKPCCRSTLVRLRIMPGSCVHA
jgi:uroporphyrin-III C-methyltransferase/precorrin-2 dehydrogenase/sirohydrochlorin ferrochelatase